MKIYLFLLAFFLYGCTFNVSIVNTEGEASDVIDETNANTPTMTATIPIRI